MQKLLLALSLISSTQFALAGVELTNISSSDLKTITSETSAAFKHTTVSPAVRIGEDYSYDLGIISGSTSITRIEKIFSKSGSGNIVNTIPKFAIIGNWNLPYNLSIEVSALPQISTIFTVSASSAALKWDFSDLAQLPVQVSTKAYMGTSKVGWNQTISNVDTNMNYSQKISGLDLQASRTYSFITPYANLGYLTSTGKLNASGTTSIFNTSYTASSKAEENVSGLSYGIGVSSSMAFMNFAIELISTLNTSTTNFKMSGTF